MSFAAGLCGCSPGQQAFLQAQVCVQNDEGLSAFLREMRMIAQSGNAKFVDNSSRTARELKATGYVDPQKSPSDPVINIGIEREGHVVWMAGNLGLPPYQIAFGFVEGADPPETRRLADTVVSRLSEYWRVEVIPNDKGAKPMASCGSRS
jgi:hypothetical protein